MALLVMMLFIVKEFVRPGCIVSAYVYVCLNYFIKLDDSYYCPNCATAKISDLRNHAGQNLSYALAGMKALKLKLADSEKKPVVKDTPNSGSII